MDLFNAFYFWEAHEQWEMLWRRQPRESPRALLLKGLIQLAAALLKIRSCSIDGARSLSEKGLRNLGLAARDDLLLFGLDLDRVREEFINYFRPLSWRTLPPLGACVPLLKLAERPTS